MEAEQTRGVRAGMLRAQGLHRMVQSDLEGKLPQLAAPPATPVTPDASAPAGQGWLQNPDQGERENAALTPSSRPPWLLSRRDHPGREEGRHSGRDLLFVHLCHLEGKPSRPRPQLPEQVVRRKARETQDLSSGRG